MINVHYHHEPSVEIAPEVFPAFFSCNEDYAPIETHWSVEDEELGIWTMHYTITAWKSQDELKAFSKTGEHLYAMQRSGELAWEIRTYTYEADQLPGRMEAKRLLLEKGRVVSF